MRERLTLEFWRDIKCYNELERTKFALKRAQQWLVLIADYSHNIELSMSRIAVKSMVVETLKEIDEIIGK